MAIRSLSLVIATIFLCIAAANKINANFVTVGSETFLYSMEDVMIMLRVANNFSMGSGLYFNVGEVVAANTSLFWPIFLAPIFTFFDQTMSIQVISYLAVGIVVLTAMSMSYASKTASVAILCLAFFVTSPSTLFYLSFAWENVPQMFFASLGFFAWCGYIFKQKDALSQVGIALLFFTAAYLFRPDAALLFIVPTLQILLLGWQQKNFVKTASFVAVPVAAIAVYFSLHYSIYQDFVPNTYYMKLTGGAGPISLGIEYFFRNIFLGGNVFFYLGALACWFVKRKLFSLTEKLALISCSIFIVYIISAGGDFFPNGRFFMLMTPFLMVIFSDKALNIIEEKKSKNSLSSIVLTLGMLGGVLSSILVGNVTLYGNQSVPVIRNDNIVRQPLALMSSIPVIRHYLDPVDGSIAMFYIGNLPYYLAEYNVTDLLGKADAYVSKTSIHPGAPHAHNKWDFNYSLRDNRVAAIYVRTFNSDEEAEKQIKEATGEYFHAELWLNPIFKENYIVLPWRHLNVPSSNGLAIRKDLLNRFCKSPPSEQMADTCAKSTFSGPLTQHEL